MLVDALQKIGTRYRPQRQLWAAAVVLSTRGLELTLLKNYLDDGGDYHTVYKVGCGGCSRARAHALVGLWACVRQGRVPRL